METTVSRFFKAQDGLKLHARIYTPPTGQDHRLPLVCLPGLSRNARDFHHLALLVSRHPTRPRSVIALDYRGRGLSAHDENTANYTVAVESRDVVTVLEALDIKRAVFAGTSRGGLILHVLAAVRLDLIAGAILNDIGPEIEPAGLAEIRDYLSKRPAPASFGEAAEALSRIHGATFPALSTSQWQDMAEAIYVERDGRIFADHDPALAAQLRDIDFSRPLPTLWRQFDLLATGPLLVVRGEHSRLFSESTFARMAGKVSTRTITARGQGHAPLLHHKDIYPAIAAFLEMV